MDEAVLNFVFLPSQKTFWIKSKFFVIVQNEFGPIEGQGIKLKFFTPLQLQFDVKKQILSFYNPPTPENLHSFQIWPIHKLC